MLSVAGVRRRLLSTIGLSAQTKRSLKLDWLRLKARASQYRKRPITSASLHIGCGSRHFEGWLNVDLYGSDWNVDLQSPLPWPSNTFEVVLGQHVIEHLELTDELLPLLRELHRVCKDGAEVWLSCPDMAKVCTSYIEDRGQRLVIDRMTRWPFSLDGAPAQQMINLLFHQKGQHKNLFDFELLSWTLKQAGFSECRRTSEAELLSRYPKLPPRNDESQTLYVVAFR